MRWVFLVCLLACVGWTQCLTGLFVKSTSIESWQFTLIEPASENLTYSDSNMVIVFGFSKTQVGFTLQNKLKTGIVINWDNWSYVSEARGSSRVIHSGIKYIDRDRPQASSTVPPGNALQEAITPAENIKWSGRSWYIQDLFWNTPKYSDNNRKFQVYMPLEIAGVKQEYSFTFLVKLREPVKP